MHSPGPHLPTGHPLTGNGQPFVGKQTSAHISRICKSLGGPNLNYTAARNGGSSRGLTFKLVSRSVIAQGCARLPICRLGAPGLSVQLLCTAPVSAIPV